MQVTDGLTVAILPNSDHEYLMTSKQVEAGYGITEHALRMTRLRNEKEFLNDRHFVLGKGVTNCYPSVKIQPHQVFWTKRGIVRLGFFIKSERAKLFRDWAEDLVLNKVSKTEGFTRSEALSSLPAPQRRTKANRLTPARMVDIMADVCRIKDDGLRLSLVDKLMGGVS